MSLLALRPLDLAIFGTMGGLWIFGAAFIVFVWRWAIRTQAERDAPVMRADDVPPPPPAPRAMPIETAKPTAQPSFGSALPQPTR